MNEAFSELELAALAEAYPLGPPATVLLERAGFPRAHVPSMIGVSAAVFWRLVNAEIAAGVLENGSERILKIAEAQYPASPIFGSTGIRRVMLVGAVPDGLPAMRPDRDLAEAVRAVERAGISVTYRLAADVTDLDVLGVERPHLLHLACHGDGEFLIFEGPSGPRPVAIDDLLGLLDGYARTSRHRLRGIYLASCDGAAQAQRFLSVADRVVAFAGELADGCAPAFTAHLYRALITAKDLHEAAGLALDRMTSVQPSCRWLANRLIALPRRTSLNRTDG
ncbi:effector-associated domain EAD1-containing protein [Micromonospora violae]|uniref:effector-associated domain EAD1-containing protein n=1 Tax=Micromonospora violae TaxID=1278207 RepID=UPI0033EE193F